MEEPRGNQACLQYCQLSPVEHVVKLAIETVAATWLLQTAQFAKFSGLKQKTRNSKKKKQKKAGCLAVYKTQKKLCKTM